MPSSYYDQSAVASGVAQGGHRDMIGGLWDELGKLQLAFLIDQGLMPEHTLVDIGCGSLRLGVHAVRYLNKGNYWGTDLNKTLMDAGYEREIILEGLSEKLPRDHLIEDSEFNFIGMPRLADFSIAQSVFTHLPLNHLRLCLINFAEFVDYNHKFFCTFFLVDKRDVALANHQIPGGIVTHPHKDPYHYCFEDIIYISDQPGWSPKLIGDWGHPRNQKMVLFQRS